MRAHTADFFILSLSSLALISIFSFLSKVTTEDKFNKLIGNDIENIRNLKNDCEKSLPRDQECILIYEFTPVKRAEK